MEPLYRSCSNCRWTRPRTPADDLSVPAEDWCSKKERYLRSMRADAEVCEHYESWKATGRPS